MRVTELALALLLVPTLVAQESFDIRPDPNDPARPLSSLVSQLRKRAHLAISYEDPRYSKREDMKGPHASFRYSSHELDGPDGPELTVDRMLREYAASGGLTYTVKREMTRLYVIPEEAKNSRGERVRQESILDTVINIPPGRRDGGQMLQAICDAVKQQTGYEIGIGPSAPANTLARYSTDEGVYNQTARAALAQFLDSATLARTFVWDLYYDPDDGGYGLNFAYVGFAGPVRK